MRDRPGAHTVSHTISFALFLSLSLSYPKKKHLHLTRTYPIISICLSFVRPPLSKVTRKTKIPPSETITKKQDTNQKRNLTMRKKAMQQAEHRAANVYI